MHAITILHRILSTSFPEIHAKRLTSLLAAVEAVVSGSRLTLSDMGRGLAGQAAVKHNIKRIDRLLGNDTLHTEIPGLYEALVRQCLADISMPLIVIDWSDLTPDRQWQLLRASVAIEGRSMTLYEQVHPQSRATSPKKSMGSDSIDCKKSMGSDSIDQSQPGKHEKVRSRFVAFLTPRVDDFQAGVVKVLLVARDQAQFEGRGQVLHYNIHTGSNVSIRLNP